MNTDSTYSWIKELDDALWPNISNPALGSIPSFPWTQLSENLGKILHLDTLEISLTQAEWLTSEQLLPPFGENPVINSIALTPLKGEAYSILSQEDFHKLITWTLTQSQEHTPYIDQEFINGFSQFFTLTLLSQLSPLPYLKGLTPTLTNTSLPKETAYTFDVHAQWKEHSINIRFVITNTLRDQFYQHMQKQTFEPTQGIREKNAQLNLKLSIATCELSKKLMQSIQPGDLIPLNNTSFDPQTKKGRVTAYSHGLTLFKGNLLPEGKVEITEIT
jgi:hypothetical protein